MSRTGRLDPSRGRQQEAERTVRIDGARLPSYDTLVYALGSVADTAAVPGAGAHALDGARDAEALAERLRWAVWRGVRAPHAARELGQALRAAVAVSLPLSAIRFSENIRS
ncbi:hypothetical protein [Streptomyces buecherae]|uniref:hypothetical protein n=1 Tax=Streptomyces buecherae TaxID=2763006 RepID=UPI0037912B75